jgi:hypothetical protein
VRLRRTDALRRIHPNEVVMAAKRPDFVRKCPRRDSNPCYSLERAVT